MRSLEFDFPDGRSLYVGAAEDGGINIFAETASGEATMPSQEEWERVRADVLNFLDAVFLPAPPAGPDALSVQGQEQESGEPDIQV